MSVQQTIVPGELSDAITKVASKVTKSYDVVSMFPVICSSIHLPLQAWYLAKSTFSRFLDAFISFTILSSYIFASKFGVFDGNDQYRLQIKRLFAS